MSDRHFEEIERVFLACANLTGERLIQSLNEMCGDDRELRSEVLDLIVADRKNHDSGDFLNWFEKASRLALPNAGEQVARYRLIREIGRGAYGCVYLARDQQGNKAAVKFLLWSQSPGYVTRFKREAAILENLEHRNIAALLEKGVYKDIPYIVTEYIDGLPLDRHISQRGIATTIEEKVDWLIQLCEAVAFVNRRLILHRDIKPSNILIRKDGLAVVTDFGISKSLEEDEGESSLTATGQMIGTPAFMSPEQLTATDTPTVASDVYGIGAVLYFLLTGSPPAGGQSIVEITDAVRFEDPVSPRRIDPEVDESLSRICMRCLRKSPEERYVSATELAKDLLRWRQGQAIELADVPLITRIRNWITRNPTTTTGGIAMLLLVTVSVFYILTLWQTSESNYRDAVSTIESLSEMAEQAGSSYEDLELNITILRRLVVSIEALGNPESLDSALIKRLAVAHLEWGRLEKMNGNKGESEFLFRKAMSLFAQLSARHPDELQYEFDVFHCLLSLHDHDAALKQIKEVLRRNDTNPEWRAALAHSYLRCGDDRIGNNMALEAVDYLNEAEYAITSLIAVHGTADSGTIWHKTLGEIYFSQFRCHLELGEISQAKTKLDAALTTFAQCHKFHAADPSISYDYICSLLAKSAISTIDLDFELANSLLETADEVSRRYRTEHSDSPPSRTCRFFVLLQKAIVAVESEEYEGLARHREAIEQLLEICRQSENGVDSLASLEATYVTALGIVEEADPAYALRLISRFDPSLRTARVHILAGNPSEARRMISETVDLQGGELLAPYYLRLAERVERRSDETETVDRPDRLLLYQSITRANYTNFFSYSLTRPELEYDMAVDNLAASQAR